MFCATRTNDSIKGLIFYQFEGTGWSKKAKSKISGDVHNDSLPWTLMNHDVIIQASYKKIWKRVLTFI